MELEVCCTVGRSEDGGGAGAFDDVSGVVM